MAQVASRVARVTRQELSQHHFAIGWVGLAIAVMGGVALDAMLGTKTGLYLDVENETRRLMWRLAHAHAAGVALVHIALGAYLNTTQAEVSFSLRMASRLISVALLLLPAGFALGGIQLFGDEPGLGIFLTPIGGLALAAATVIVAFDAHSLTSR